MLPYNRKDYNSIYEFLKNKAQELSKGRWTDWSDGDIGAVLVHLMSYLGDMNNYQIDATGAELFLNTAIERSSLMEITKLIGYEPKHFMSARCEVTIGFPQLAGSQETFFENTMVCTEDESIVYSNIEQNFISNGTVRCMMYEGRPTSSVFSYNEITSDGKIFLPDYDVGMNTIRVRINTVNNNEPIIRVQDVRFISGELGYSAHVSLDQKVYVQLPSFWKDIIDSSSIIKVSYNRSTGTQGSVGANELVKFFKSSSMSSKFEMTNTPSIGGSNPESVAEIKKLAPIAARTMYTIVTKKDFDDVATFVDSVAQTKSFDYLDGEPPEGEVFPFYRQPDDYYKVLMLAVPTDPTYDSIFNEYDQKKWYGKNFDANKLQHISIFNGIGKDLVEYIDDRRLASLKVTYSDPEYLKPSIDLDIYINEEDLRKTTIAFDTVCYIKACFGRNFVKIGESIYGSVIGKEVLNALPQIDYLEVHAPEHNIPCEPWQYIDMANAEFVVRVNDERAELPTIYPNTMRYEMIKGDSIVVYNPNTEKTESIDYFTQLEYLQNPNRIPEEIKVAFVLGFTILYVPSDWVLGGM